MNTARFWSRVGRYVAVCVIGLFVLGAAEADQFEQFMPSDLVARQNRLTAVVNERESNIVVGRALIRSLKDKTTRNANATGRLLSTVTYLGVLRADEAVTDILDVIEIRKGRAGSTHAPEDATTIKALGAIGKASSLACIDYLAKDKSSARATMYLRVIFLVEGPDVGRLLLQRAAEKENDPDRKARLQKAVELFADAGKVVP